ncbi:hypothetical protein E2C01_037255 [Portunus trituberculatus]|uniref:Uncharacterized protein n=1 Tax=Portunus trituberculatus TaxID=210409 RepID=A0A5B7FDP7_PORTR|nr:hypothetical protein [Portunus trituberculatus]
MQTPRSELAVAVSGLLPTTTRLTQPRLTSPHLTSPAASPVRYKPQPNPPLTTPASLHSLHRHPSTHYTNTPPHTTYTL